MPAVADRDALGMETAIAEAQQSYGEGGIPIGAALVYHREGEPARVLGRGHNERIQKSSAILHGEIAALNDAGRLPPETYRSCTMYTTLSPCSMCTGAILLYKIPRVVIGENANFKGAEETLTAHGVEVVVKDDSQCKSLMEGYIREKPEDWNEDIGEVDASV